MTKTEGGSINHPPLVPRLGCDFALREDSLGFVIRLIRYRSGPSMKQAMVSSDIVAIAGDRWEEF